MGTQQSRQGNGRQGSRQQSQQGDRRPQQDRDLQRNKQSDHGQQRQGAEPAGEQHAGGPGSLEHSRGANLNQENRQRTSERRQQSPQNVYGDFNYAASRQYTEATKDFAQSGRVEPAARAAAPRSESDVREMQDAEAEGKRHAKGEDPALNRRSSQTPQSPAPRPGKEDE
jgi:hypothetical protein